MNQKDTLYITVYCLKNGKLYEKKDKIEEKKSQQGKVNLTD